MGLTLLKLLIIQKTVEFSLLADQIIAASFQEQVLPSAAEFQDWAAHLHAAEASSIMIMKL